MKMRFLLALICLSTSTAWAGKLEIPLHLNVDGGYVRTAAKLALPLTLDDKLPAGAKEAFPKLVEAIASRNIATVQQLLELAPPASGEAEQDAAKRTAALVDALNAAFHGMRDVRVIGHLPSDNGLVILWRDGPGKSLVRSFIYRSDPGRKTFLQPSSQGTPVDTFLVNAVDKSLAAGDTPAEQPATSDNLEQLPLTQSGVSLQFKKSPIAQIPNLLGQPVAQRIAGKVTNPQEVFELATPESRRKLESWYQTLPEASRTELQGLWSSDRKPLRLLNAAPVYIVIQDQMPDVSLHHAGAYTYEYYVGQGNGRVALANVFRESLFDDALKPALGRLMAPARKQ